MKLQTLNLLSSLLLFVPALGAQNASRVPFDKGVVASVPPLPSMAFRKKLRKELMKRVGSGVILIRGAVRRPDYLSFLPSQNFFYLTGIREPHCDLLLFPETGKELLLIPPTNRFIEDWEGKGLRPGKEGQKATGIASVQNGGRGSRKLLRLLKAALARLKNKTIWIEFDPETLAGSGLDNAGRALREWQGDPLDGRMDRNQRLREALQKQFPEAEIQNVSPHLRGMRVIKRPEEIPTLAFAAQVASMGIAEAIKACRPGQREWELAAVADYVFRRHGAWCQAYAPIVGSGPNGNVLHHWRINKVMKKGELVVMDFAPIIGGYAADVTRTFPVGGKFTPRARKLVQDVYDAQQAILAIVRPGVRFGELSRVGRELLIARGYKPGIHIKHGPSHHLGMAVHDVTAGADSYILREGMVITVEPGAYLGKEGMGCRIEDDILVTKDGYRLLSAGCPSDPDGIEALMMKNGMAKVPTGAEGLRSLKPKK
ncbi:MAG TPA: aminopeptidase P family protein [Planctomycetes bacterium]|nr:aminopeptidase P family protein [Planctomycetota bacterium]